MKTNRLQEILRYLTIHKSATVAELCDVFQVSDMTIRRDLIQMEQQQQVVRFHGGAVINSTINPRSEDCTDVFLTRMLDNSQLKLDVANACCHYVKEMSASGEASSIYIASGSTAYAFVQQLPKMENTTLITDNLYTCKVLMKNGAPTVLMVGGQMLLPSSNVVGYWAEQMISSFNIDVAFISTYGIDEAGNIYVFDLAEVGMFNAIIKAAKRTVLMVDRTKFGQRNLVQLCTLGENFTVITNRGAPEIALENLRNNGVEVILADPAP